MKKIDKYCGVCERNITEEDGEIVKDENGDERCPICGGKLCDEAKADEIYKQIEDELDAEDELEKRRECKESI